MSGRTDCRIPIWLALGGLVVSAALHAVCGRASHTHPPVIVLGVDGLDYHLTRRLIDEGRLPHLARLAASGTMTPLETTMPPQSPVAWSTFTTGLSPEGHGIFDFVHRDPETMAPFLSTTTTVEPWAFVRVGRWQLPLVGGEVRLLRKGRPFWDAVTASGVPATIIRMPANFPPSGVATRELSGMGTPDLLGSYGTFSFYTPFTFGESEVPGGRIYPVEIADHVVTGRLVGPDNPFLRTPTPVSAEFQVYLDPEQPVAKIVVGTEERVVHEGEWTDWVPVEFQLLPFQTLRGICRFYLKQVRPVFELYVTPLNMDPVAPAMPISTPASYARDLADRTGRFYTQGMPEDTSAASAGILSPDEFLAQARLALREQTEQFQLVLERFDGGLLFYYFGTIDQVSHMMWRAMDPEHPAYDAARDEPYARVVEDFYVELDTIVGYTLDAMSPRTVLVVMSDHGFASWRRSFHLNAWLEQHGYLTVSDSARRNDSLFAAVDWTRTRAYGMGLNALYLNLRGRERHGIVEAADRDALLAEIADRLRRTLDPATGTPAVSMVYHPPEATGSGDLRPDLILGYAKGTRSSNESALGAVPADVFVDNTGAWSGDHCMDPADVPGVLVTSRPLGRTPRGLEDFAGAILAELGLRDWHGASEGPPRAHTRSRPSP